MEALVTRRITIECDRIPYQFHNVPLKKILNWIFVEASIYIKPEKPWGWPTHLQIEPDAHCNLRCALCPVTTGLGRPIGHMNASLFKRLMDEIGDYIFLILLWDWGEPFLNPDIYEMISYAKKKGIKVVSSTNGHLFKQIKHADEVIRSGLDSLIIAVDGITQETYELYRQGGDLESVLQGIRMVVTRKCDLNSETPLINLRSVVMKQNEHEIPKLKDLARSLGVDALTLKTLNPYGSDTEFLPENYRYRRFKYAPDGTTRLRRKHNPCKHLWNMPAIHWNGTVCMCTYDSKEEHILGDLNTDTFGKIWFGTPSRRLRRQFRSNWEQIGLCNECSYAYEGGSCIDEIIADAIFFPSRDL